MTAAFTETAAIVVHHRSMDTLGDTLAGLVATGIPARSILLIDNSQDAVSEAALEAVTPPGVVLIRTENRGYGAAVNVGLDELLARTPLPANILVATHEVLIDQDAVAKLISALNTDLEFGAIGPLLVSPRGQIWSIGGRLTSKLRLARHNQAAPSRGDGTVIPTTWLDGAVVLYRTSAVSQLRMDERYFLYMEEVDYHLQLAQSGWPVGICLSALASQDSEGMPVFYLVRNSWLFQRKWGRPGFRHLSISYVAARAIFKSLVRRDRAQTIAVMKGWLAGWRIS